MADIKITDLVDQQAFDQIQKLQRDIDAVEQQYVNAARVLIKGLKVKVEVVGDLDKLTTIANSGMQQAAQATQQLTKAVQHQGVAVGQTTNVISRELSEVEKLNKEQRQQVDLDKDAVSMAREIVGTYQQQVQNLVRVETELKDVSKQKKDLDDQYKSGAISQAQYQSQLANVITTERELKREKTEIQQLMSIEEKMNQAVKGSYKELAQQLNMLEQAYMRLTEDEKQSPFGKRLAEAQIELKQHMKDLDADMGNFQRNVGDYAIAGQSLKSQLKDLVVEIATLTVEYRNMSEEERNSAAGEELANKIAQLTEDAGTLKDAIADTNDAIKNSASDTRAFDQIGDALQTVTATFAVAKGAATAFGISTKDVEKAEKQLVAAISIMNGLQTIQTKLQKQSALMQGVRIVQTKAATVAEELDTAAKSKNIIVSKAATVAQAAFNLVAEANPYVLLATALVTVVGALAAFALGTSEATEEEKKAQSQAEKMIEARKHEKEVIANTVAEQITKYESLRIKWNELRTTQEKNQFIEDNASAFDDLGLTINDVSDAENVFVGQTDDVIKALQLRAQAAAAYNLYLEAYQQKLKNDIGGSRANGRYHTKVKVGDTLTKEEEQYLRDNGYSDNGNNGKTQDFSNPMFGQGSVKSQRAADALTAKYAKEAQEIVNRENETLNKYESLYNDLRVQADEAAAKVKQIEGGGHSGHSGGGNSSSRGGGGGKTDAQKEAERLAEERKKQEQATLEELAKLRIKAIKDEEERELAALAEEYVKRYDAIVGEEAVVNEARELLFKEYCKKEDEINAKYNAKRDKERMDVMNKAIKDYEKQNAIEQQKRNDALQKEANDLANAYADGKITKEQYEKAKEDLTIRYAEETARAQIAYLEMVLEDEQIVGDARLEIERKLASAKINLDKDIAEARTKSRNEEVEKEKKAEEEKKAAIRDTMQMTMDAVNAAADLASSIFDRQMQEIDDKSEKNQAAHDAEIANIERLEETGAISKEEAESRKRAANAKSKAQEEQIAKEKAALELKQAKINKAMSIMQIVMNTSMAIMNALATTQPFWAAPTMAAIAATTGAIQLATVIAQPLPKYKDGTTFHPGGPAIVGDGGKVEGVLLPNGKAFLTPDSPTMVNLPAGAKVIPDASTLNLDGLNPTPLVSVARSSDGSPIIINDYNDLQREIAKGNSLTKQMMKQQAKIARDQRYAAYIASRM